MIPFHKQGCEFSHKNSAALPEKGAVLLFFHLAQEIRNVPIVPNHQIFSYFFKKDF